MNRKILIIYFSGTGNTAAVCQSLKNALEIRSTKALEITIGAGEGAGIGEGAERAGNGSQQSNVIEVMLMRAEDFLADGKPVTTDFSQLGIAFPVHGFSSPSIVEKIIDQLPEGQGKSAFLLYTAGDCVRINQMAGRRMKTLLKRRHYDVSYERLIVMGSNWLIGYTDAFNRQLYTAAQAKARHMALQIKQQEKRLYAFVPVLHHAGWLFHKMERLGAKLFGYTLYTADTCTQCGKCIQACPVGNIYHKEGGIQFRGHCQMCMRCLYQCPVHAIRSHGLQWMVLKSGYSLETILDVSLDGEDIEKKGIVTAETKGYFKHFISYFEDIDR